MSINIGDKASITHVVTQEDIMGLAKITGDNNPLHLDEEYASKTRFERPIAHGILSAGLISAVLGTKLPGPGTIYISQNCKFLAPVYVGDSITAYAEVIDKKNDKPIYTLKTTVANQEGVEIISGEAVVYYRT